VTEDI